MAEKVKTKTPGKPANIRTEREKLVRALLAVLVIVALSVAVVFSLYGMRRLLFTGNPRLTLREISVRTVGYWEGKERELANRCGIRIGRNLYSQDVREIRRKLLEIPNVEGAEVIRVLPDLLQLKVIERIPRAVLSNPRSPWVVDENGVVVPRLESMCATRNMPLPVVIGVNERSLTAGQKLESLQNALNLIMLTVRSFPDIEMIAVDVRNPDKLKFFMRYRRVKVCTVLLPVHKTDLTFLLSTLQSAIIRAEQLGDNSTTFDLSFDGNVVIK